MDKNGSKFPFFSSVTFFRIRARIRWLIEPDKTKSDFFFRPTLHRLTLPL